jgi:hypothetical protein
MPTDKPEPTIKVSPNEIAVELDQLPRVTGMLKDIAVSCTSEVANPDLNLALLTLDNVSTLADATTPDTPTPLDALISYLRESFKRDFGGWIPAIGKNRTVGPVTGSPYTGGGVGVADPYTGGYTGKGAGGAQLAQGEELPDREGTDAGGTRVGILDTQLFRHPDLVGRYLANHSTFVTKSQEAAAAAVPPADQAHANLAHATFIAGVIVQRAPDADLVIGHVLDADATEASSWEVAVKMVEFASAGVAVLNISFGAVTYDDEPPLVLQRAVTVLGEKGVMIVAAAGNDGPDSKKMWPAALESVVAVGAGRPSSDAGAFKPAAFSADADWVGLMAPGEDVYSTYEAAGYATWRGTSFAAAAVSGAIARLMQTEDMTADAASAWLGTPPAARKRLGVGALLDDIGPRKESTLG